LLDHLQTRLAGAAWCGTTLGRFVGFNTTGRSMRLEGGRICWKGTLRRTEMFLSCRPSDNFLDVEEIDRCVYRGHFGTPMFCTDDYADWVRGLSDLDLTDFIPEWETVE
jgi:hypothetical protein